MLDTAFPAPLDNEPEHPHRCDSAVNEQCHTVLIAVCQINGKGIYAHQEETYAGIDVSFGNAKNSDPDQEIGAHQQGIYPDNE